MFKLYASLLSLLLLAIICSASVNSTVVVSSRPRLDGRIVGGKPIRIKNVPYQVSLQHRYHFCGGSLISKLFVLTAAHCVSNSNIQVRIGSTFSNWGGRLVRVSRVTRHSLYNADTLDYDFAILKLQNYSSTGLISGFVRLPAAFEDVNDNTLLTVSGWGVTNNAQESSIVLRSVKVPKVNQQQCNSTYGSITERMICAGYTQGGKDACQGDSGGPLVHQGVVVGVVSWGYGCAKPNYPGVYSRVSSVRKWITEHTGL